MAMLSKQTDKLLHNVTAWGSINTQPYCHGQFPEIRFYDIVVKNGTVCVLATYAVLMLLLLVMLLVLLVVVVMLGVLSFFLFIVVCLCVSERDLELEIERAR